MIGKKSTKTKIIKVDSKKPKDNISTHSIKIIKKKR